MNETKHKLLVVLQLRTVAGRKNLSGILDYADGKPNWELVLFEPEQLSDAARFRQILSEQNLDGAIVTLPLGAPLMSQLVRSPLAIVFVNIPNVKLPANRRHVSFVYTDNEDVGRKGGEHLLSIGKFNSFGFVNHPSGEFWSHERERAFRKCVERHAPFFARAKEPLDTWLLALPKPTGVMIAGDDLTVPVISTCQQCGLDVPGQVAVIGSGTIASSARGNNAILSTVAPDMHTLGYRSAKEMDRLLRGGSDSVAREIVIAAEDVIVRRSSAHTAPAAQLVTDIRAFISNHYAEDISVKDILSSAKCSRRLAELRFRQIEGMSIRQALESVRLREATKLLRTTDATATQIARRCGLKSVERLSRLFVRQTGQTIREARHRRTSRP